MKLRHPSAATIYAAMSVMIAFKAFSSRELIINGKGTKLVQGRETLRSPIAISHDQPATRPFDSAAPRQFDRHLQRGRRGFCLQPVLAAANTWRVVRIAAGRHRRLLCGTRRGGADFATRAADVQAAGAGDVRRRTAHGGE